MAPHSSTRAWKIPWMEEPGGLQSMGSRRIGHNWATSLSLFTFLHWRRKWQPTPVFLPGESQGWGSLVAAIYRVTQSRTQVKWLSSSSIQNLPVDVCIDLLRPTSPKKTKMKCIFLLLKNPVSFLLFHNSVHFRKYGPAKSNNVKSKKGGRKGRKHRKNRGRI